MSLSVSHCPGYFQPWFPCSSRESISTARIHGDAAALCDSDNDSTVEEKQLIALVERGVDGLSSSPTEKLTRRMTELVAESYPLVFLDRNIER